jgi:6-phosphogluconate dehydrogenase
MMQLGMFGLGRMGGNMSQRLEQAGHRVVGYDRDPKVSQVGSIEELVQSLDAPRIVWVMVPSGTPTDDVIETLAATMSPGDIVIDGGNTYFRDTERHNAMLRDKQIQFVDVGVSGGVWGLQEGYCLMSGGDKADIDLLRPIFDALAPPDGWAHVGPTCTGHYTKMVHNGIEYGLMQAYAEGYELLAAKDLVTDVHGAFKAWTRGTVVRSWLLDLLVRALEDDPDLDTIKGYVVDSGEGRWTVEEAIENRVPMHVISAALFARFESRQDDSPAMKAVAALRHQFGGHAVTEAGPTSGTGDVRRGERADVAGPSSGSGATS